jgi:TetR/AcrR family transcriptional repressor of nem operon
MARTREFEIDEVLQNAMEAFWKRGYAATSMADIYEATGLKPGSLYAAFKDKEELFRRCFETYAAHFRATLPQDRSGLAAIEAWLSLQARLAADDPDRKGCLIINTVTERDIHSAATRALASGRLQEIRDFFTRHLSLAVAAGEARRNLPVEVHADALLGAVVGVMALGRAGADKRLIENVARAAFAPLTA